MYHGVVCKKDSYQPFTLDTGLLSAVSFSVGYFVSFAFSLVRDVVSKIFSDSGD